MDNPIYGKHKLHWDFPTTTSQNEIIEVVITKLNIYQKDLMLNS